MIVETDAIARLRRGLERRWLSHIVQENAPSQSRGSVFGQSFEHHAGVNPHVAFGVILRRLLDAFHRSNLDRKSTRLNSSHVASSYAVFCLKQKTPPLIEV